MICQQFIQAVASFLIRALIICCLTDFKAQFQLKNIISFKNDFQHVILITTWKNTVEITVNYCKQNRFSVVCGKMSSIVTEALLSCPCTGLSASSSLWMQGEKN